MVKINCPQSICTTLTSGAACFYCLKSKCTVAGKYYAYVPHPFQVQCSLVLMALQWIGCEVCNQTARENVQIQKKSFYPGTPPASMWLANVTSCDQTSYCHFCRPMTPQRTFPEWTPTRMLISTPVASRTFLSHRQTSTVQCNCKTYLSML